MTQLAPASRSMGAEMSPVRAPLGSVWQSCPPTATGLPRSMSATAARTVAGGERRSEVPEFQDAFRRELAQVNRMLGGKQEPTPEIRRAVASQTLERMITQAAIAEEVQRLGIAVPDEAVRQAVFEIPAFR